MSYKFNELPHYVNTAGKITILTAVTGLLLIALVFIFNAGKTELLQVEAQTASTTLTVLNTPPSWDVFAFEETESSTSSPTNTDDDIVWAAIATDSNDAPYFLIVCSTSTAPTPKAASNINNLGTQPPVCTPTSSVWAVSASTTSGERASAATTTASTTDFAEANNWWAWICDDDPVNPRCNNTFSQGTSSTNTSPFHVNRRPIFTWAGNDGPVDPGGLLTFVSTSSDPDSVGGQDDVYLVICNSALAYSSSTNNCTSTSTSIASSTIGYASNAQALYTLVSIVQDQIYAAHAFMYDEHGHEADYSGFMGQAVDFEVNNVAPTVAGGTITIGTGTPLYLTVPGDETPDFELTFVTADANSCDAVGGGNADEITDYIVSFFRSSVGTTSCDGSGANYDPNDCYESGIGTAVWNLTCTASTTTCDPGGEDDTMLWECTFPLWYLTDPTDAGTPFDTDSWSAGVAAIDNNFATGTMATSSSQVELLSFSSINLITDEIPYGALEPGQNNPSLIASTTFENVGNTGLDQDVEGESMCTTFTPGNECPVSASSTIPESQQQFASTSVSYNSPLAGTLSSSTVTEVELDVLKTTSTSSPQLGTTWWGIGVPGTISLSGSYTGLNTFYARKAEIVDWTP